jgi:hypothetical protein
MIGSSRLKKVWSKDNFLFNILGLTVHQEVPQLFSKNLLDCRPYDQQEV